MGCMVNKGVSFFILTHTHTHPKELHSQGSSPNIFGDSKCCPVASTGKWHCGHGKDQMYIGGIMRVLRMLQKYNGLRKVEA